jgi:hypothetical protein
MGHQIIQCPDGMLAVFSSNGEAWILTNATPEDLLDYYAEKAARQAREDIQLVLDAVLAGESRKVYYQFTMTFDEADAASVAHGGESLRPPDPDDISPGL